MKNKYLKKKLGLIKIIVTTFMLIVVVVCSFLILEYKKTKDEIIYIERIEIRAYKTMASPEKVGGD